MENPYIDFFPFFSPLPYLYYQSWNQPNYLHRPTTIVISK